jgi:hypothetical protein
MAPGRAALLAWGGKEYGHPARDGVAGRVVDRPGLHVAPGHPQRVLDPDESVTCADHELRRHRRPVRAGLHVSDGD